MPFHLSVRGKHRSSVLRMQFSTIRSHKSVVNPLPDRIPGVPSPKRHSHPTRVRDHPARHIDQILHHASQAAAGNGFADGHSFVPRHPFLTQLRVDPIAFFAQVGQDRRVTRRFFIRPRHPFFLFPRIIERRDA